jgi:SAM-dependent methyltransferase
LNAARQFAGVRRFTSEYLDATREGMWADSRAALEPCSLADRERVLDVGAGTGALTAVLREETPAPVVAVDADRRLLREVPPPRLLGDARRLPVRDGAVDLVVCQALLVNLPDPAGVIAEFASVSSDLVAAIEPDNAAVSVESTVDAEERLARRARARYLAGVDTDVTLGALRDRFESAGLRDVTVRRYEQVRTVDGPYAERDVEAARRKATGEGLAADRETILAGPTTPAAFDDLREAWRDMGRTVVEQMRDGAYRRRETIPFFVTVGRVD